MATAETGGGGEGLGQAERKEWRKEEGMRKWEAGLTRDLSQV